MQQALAQHRTQSHETHVSQQSSPNYEVRLATGSELDDVFRLRYSVFFEELGAHNSSAIQSKMDVDEYDSYCDHLVVLSHGKIIGTYRLLPLKRLPRYLSGCYSENEFNLGVMRQEFADNLLEIGRSCIDKSHRNGNVAKLLWSGVISYMRLSKPTALFGCVSTHDLSHCLAKGLNRHFQNEGQWDDRFSVCVTEKFSTPDFEEKQILSFSKDTLDASIPPLLWGYFNLGAKICGGPAWDKEFGCHDYLVLLECNKMSARHRKFFERIEHRASPIQTNLSGIVA